jgi:mono/diheme cytochrome c family protein
MTLTRAIACPACAVQLKVADTLPKGKRIKCPKCAASFPAPGGKKRPVPDDEEEPRPRKAVPPPDDQEGLDDEPRHRREPRKKKPRRKPQVQSGIPPIVLWVGGGMFLLGLGIVAAGVIWFLHSRGDTSSSSPPIAAAPVANTRGGRAGPSMAGPGRMGGGRGNPEGPPRGGPEASEPVAAASTSNSTESSVGERVFGESCARCHSLGGGGGRRTRGPDLSTAGRNHTADWLVQFISNPKAVKPDARMPAFGDKLEPSELQALGEYLASLK